MHIIGYGALLEDGTIEHSLFKSTELQQSLRNELENGMHFRHQKTCISQSIDFGSSKVTNSFYVIFF